MTPVTTPTTPCRTSRSPSACFLRRFFSGDIFPPSLLLLLLLPLLLFSGCGGSVDRPAEGEEVVVLSPQDTQEQFIVGKAGAASLKASGGAGSYDWTCSFSGGLDRSRFLATGKKETFSITYDGGATLSGVITISVKDGKDVSATRTVTIAYPAEGLALEANCSPQCLLTSGVPGRILFSASGGSGAYEWTAVYDGDICGGQFQFSGENDSAALVYFGGGVRTGTVSIRLTDTARHSVTRVIPIVRANEALSLSSGCPGDCRFVSGAEACIAFSASGGAGGYVWQVEYGPELTGTEFAFAGSGDAAALRYAGGRTASGVIRVVLGDAAGAGAATVVAVTGGESYTARLDLSPDTVDIGGESLATLSLQYAGGAPVVGEPVVFRIDEGPALLLDETGDPVSAPEKGRSAITDAEGRARVRVRADAINAETRALIRAGWNGGAGSHAVGELTISRGLGRLQLKSAAENACLSVAGAQSPGIQEYEMTFRLVHTGGSGAPLGDRRVRLNAIQRADSLISVSLGDRSLPATLFTDSDGETEFLLRVRASHGSLPADGGDAAISSFVLTAEDEEGRAGTRAVTLCLHVESGGSAAPVKVSPSAARLTPGIAESLSFDATGGSGVYQWRAAYNGGLRPGDFSLVAGNAAALLQYNGADTGTGGSIVLTATDSNGTPGGAVIALNASERTARLEITPDETDVGGEVVCRFQLTAADGAPVSGASARFFILHGPAHFIDARGDSIGDSTGGGDLTDAAGFAYARIRADESEDLTNVLVEGVSSAGVSATASFSIRRDLGVILLDAEGPLVWEHRGDLDPGTIYWSLPITLTHTDGSGKPLANEAVTIDAYLPSASISQMHLGDSLPLPAILTTDDDGKSEFILETAVTHGFIPENTGPVVIGNLVLIGESTRKVRGSLALIFKTHTVAVKDPLTITPDDLEVTDGQVAGFSVKGGVAPYAWRLSGAGILEDPVDEASVVYRAASPAASAVVIVSDANGDSVSANIRPAASSGTP